MDIRFHRHDEIDKQKWDDIIDHSINSLIYARSEYLDHMSPGWCALIDEDTQSVMPLPLQKKMGITYCFQPPFTQQLGVFSKSKIGESVIREFLQHTLIKSKSTSIYLNYHNKLEGLKERCNYILDLNDTFENISNKFRKDLLSKSIHSNLSYTSSTIDEVFNMYRKFIFPKTVGLKKNQLLQFEKLCNYFEKKKKVITKKIVNGRNEVLNAALFFIDDRRIYYMLSANATAGKATGANAYLLHEMIREYSGRKLIFDFEGSEIPGVQFFFKKFCPVNQPYFHFQSEQLTGMQEKATAIYRFLKR